MPEGPEVKIMMENIAHLALGSNLLSVEIIDREGSDPGNFRKKTKGLDRLPDVLPLQIIAVETKGKFGYMLLEDGSSIGITFGMTGNIRTEPTPAQLKKRGETKEKYMKHCKVKFTVKDTIMEEITIFYFHCMRNFAWMYYFTSAELGKKLSTIGPSILSEDPIDPPKLVTRWRKFNSKTICEALMEQKLISGIGNYIKAEIMYRARVYPMALVKNLSDDDLWLLYTEARDIAAEAYADGGASLYTYTGLQGDKSEFKLKLTVYNQTLDPLGNKVCKIKTKDGRTTHWVESLQIKGKEPMPKTDLDLVPLPPIPRPKIKIKAKIRASKSPSASD